MKRFLNVFFVVFVLGACHSGDPALLESLEKTWVMSESEKGYFNDIEQLLNDQMADFNAAPEAFRADTTAGFNDVSLRLQNMITQNDALKIEYADLQERLKSLSEGYNNGKMQAAEVRTEHQLIEQQMRDARQSAEEFKAALEELNQQFAEAYQAWSAQSR